MSVAQNDTTHNTVLRPAGVAVAPRVAVGINRTFRGKPGDMPGGWWARYNDAFQPATVTAHELAALVAGEGYAFAPVCRGRRKGDNFISAQHIGLDFDTETDACRLDVLAADPFIARYATLLYTSPSHTEDKPRARVVFFLDRPVTDAAQYRAYVAALLARFTLADSHAKDAARLFYGAQNAQTRVLGHVLPVSILAAPQNAPERATVRPAIDTSDRARKWAGEWCERRVDDLSRTPQGERNDATNKAAYLVGQLVGAGLTTPAWQHALVDAAMQSGLSEREAFTAVRSGWGKGITAAPDWIPNFEQPVPVVAHIQTEWPRYFPDTLPPSLVMNDEGIGLGLHNNPWFKPAPNTGAMWAFIAAYNALCMAGDVDPEQGATLAWIQGHNTHGVGRATIVRGGEMAVDAGMFEFCEFPHLECSTSTLGRKSRRIRMLPQDQAAEKYMSWLQSLAWRSLLINTYPDLPAEAGDLVDLLPAGWTWDDVEKIDDISLPLYEQRQDDIRHAIEHLYIRMNRVRDVLQIDAILRGGYDPLPLPEDAQFSNAAQFRTALDDTDPDLLDGKRADRYRAARRVGRTLAVHAAAGQARGILPVPVWDGPYPVPDGDLLPQLAAMDRENFNRGRMRLHAPDGETMDVSATAAEFRNYGDWLAEHGGRDGATVTIWARSIEKHEDKLTEDDQAARDYVQERQRRIRRKNTDTPREKQPSAVEQWMIHQGDLRARLFALQAMPESEPRMYITPDGTIFDLADVWQGIVWQVRQYGEEVGDMATFAAYSEPRERDIDGQETPTATVEGQEVATDAGTGTEPVRQGNGGVERGAGERHTIRAGIHAALPESVDGGQLQALGRQVGSGAPEDLPACPTPVPAGEHPRDSRRDGDTLLRAVVQRTELLGVAGVQPTRLGRKRRDSGLSPRPDPYWDALDRVIDIMSERGAA